MLPGGDQSQAAEVSMNFFRVARGRVESYNNGLPAARAAAARQRYADLFAVLVKHRDVVSRVTFLGAGV